MSQIYSFFSAAIIGVFTGIIIWTLFLGSMVKLFTDGGSTTIQPIFTIENIFHSALWVGLILGLIHGLLTGVLIGIFKLGEFKGALAGFLVVQAFILLWLILHFSDYFDFYRSTFSFENFTANIIVFIIGWIIASALMLVQSALTGYITAKIFQILIAKTNQLS